MDAIEDVSTLLGHRSVRITEKALDAAFRRALDTDR